MAPNPMNRPVSLRLPTTMMPDLHRHLFPGDGDEHGAVIAASVVATDRSYRLLGRHLLRAIDGVDYVPGKRGYRMLTPEFVRRCVRACAEEGLAYLAVHNHPGTHSVAFSSVDMASHRRGYPALLDILRGPPAGALVFAENAVAGDIWLSAHHQVTLDHAVVVGRTPQSLYPSPPTVLEPDREYDRQVRIFGDRGQHILAAQKVGIVGAGGVGSLLTEYLARLGVGHLVVIDDDRLDTTNYPRLVGSRPRDLRPRWIPEAIAHRAGWQPALKVRIARRLARQAQPDVRFEAIPRDITDSTAANRLIDCDAIFLAADTMRARLVVNAICHRYLIPTWQVGTKVHVDDSTGQVEDLFSVVRHLVPGQTCLRCSNLIDDTRLAEEAASPQQRTAQRYIPEVPAPSVVTLNAVAAAHAANDYLLTTVGLTETDTTAEWIRHHPLQGRLAHLRPYHDSDCVECTGRLGGGPRVSLPVRSHRT